MHRPNVTMACVVHCKGKFLFVEEIEYGKRTLNQPAGHLEMNETLSAGAARELYEETGIRADMQKLVKIYQWHAPRSRTDYLRFVFALELDEWAATTPFDPDIERALWLTPEEFDRYCAREGQCARNPLVRDSVEEYLKGNLYSLDILKAFGV